MSAGDVVDLAQWRANRRGEVSVEVTSPLLRLALGERGAVRDCVEAYGPLVQVLARRLLHDREDLDDAVQETFLELWRSAPRFDPSKASDRGFVAMIARRRIIDRNRRADRRPRTVEIKPERESA